MSFHAFLFFSTCCLLLFFCFPFDRAWSSCWSKFSCVRHSCHGIRTTNLKWCDQASTILQLSVFCCMFEMFDVLDILTCLIYMFVTCLLLPLYGDHKVHVVSSLQVLVPPGLHAVCKRPLDGWTNMAGKPRDCNSPSVRPATRDDFLSSMIPCLHTLSSSLLQLHFRFALLSSRPTSWAATSPPELVIEFHTHGAKSIWLCCCEHYKSWGMKQLLQ